MSILFAITRVARLSQWLLRLSLGFAILFFLMWAGWKCGSNHIWYHITSPSGPFYPIDRSMAVYQIASGHHITFRSSLYSQSASCVADIILVVFSLRLLWNVNLPTPQRRMILAI